MRVVVDQNVPFGREAFQDAGMVVPVPGRELRREHLRGCEVLIVRSITRVDAKLLEGTSVRFVGTCTIGTDHLDIPWLESEGIHWTAAPGCNARSVAEWTLSALAVGHLRGKLDLSRSPKAGVVGVGNVGSRVASLLETLGLEVLRNDPPRARAEGAAGFADLGKVLETCSIVSSHLPSVPDGPWPTRNLWGQNLSKLASGSAFLNSGRGTTASSRDLLAAGRARPDLFLALDVFDPEPSFPADLVDRADLATPHVAGYSVEGKVEGTRSVREELGAFLGLRSWTPPSPTLQPIDGASLLLPEGQTINPSTAPWDALASLLVAAYDPVLDDARLRTLLPRTPAERGTGFDRLRKEYPDRVEWRHRPVRNVRQLPAETWEIAQRLGFREGK
jgi:erythronate-4-phosphate dehydrogenase